MRSSRSGEGSSYREGRTGLSDKGDQEAKGEPCSLLGEESRGERKQIPGGRALGLMGNVRLTWLEKREPGRKRWGSGGKQIL